MVPLFRVGRLASRACTTVRLTNAAVAAPSSSHASYTSTVPLPAAAASATSATPACAANTNEYTKFLGAKSRWTYELKINQPGEPMECFRVMNEKAEYVQKGYELKHAPETLKKMYTSMVSLNEMDKIFYDAQRQGRISFYMTSYGEEATHIGSASALESDDVVFGQYREAGVLVWRGFTLEQFAHQCFSTTHDVGKGRQMPVHYGSRALNFQTISSPLGTQLPQAAGTAYALKREGRKNVVICYFGEGAASEGDFHVALNMAGTLKCPVIFFCRNNGYAISTPVHEQYRGDGIAARGLAYGLPTIRVDGNDLLAVHDATAKARELSLSQSTPVVIEAMTYRGGHHSTSDDSTRYRGPEEISYWSESENPITRFRLLLEKQGLWDSHQESTLRKEIRTKVLQAMGQAERTKKPAASQMFSDVYHDLPDHLKEQTQQLAAHLEKYKEFYNLDEFEKEETYVDKSREDRENIKYAESMPSSTSPKQ